MSEIVIGGIYRHFKGKDYKVLTVGLLESNKEEHVVYQSLKDSQVWIRPKKEFLEYVDNPGFFGPSRGPRFNYLRKAKDE